MSAVDQGYRYAINLPCDWIIVTSLRQPRLYHKGSDQKTYERFDTEQLADSDAVLRRFIFLLAAERVVPLSGRCHLYGPTVEGDTHLWPGSRQRWLFPSPPYLVEFMLKPCERRSGVLKLSCSHDRRND